MSEHIFELNAEWQGGRAGQGKFTTASISMAVSVPGNMGGPGVGTNPDDLILSAAANCYMISLAVFLEKNQVPVQQLSMHSKATFIVDKGPVLKKIEHNPVVKLAKEIDASSRAKAEGLFALADKYCMVSNALHGNVEVVIQGKILSA